MSNKPSNPAVPEDYEYQQCSMCGDDYGVRWAQFTSYFCEDCLIRLIDQNMADFFIRKRADYGTRYVFI